MRSKAIGQDNARLSPAGATADSGQRAGVTPRLPRSPSSARGESTSGAKLGSGEPRGALPHLATPPSRASPSRAVSREACPCPYLHPRRSGRWVLRKHRPVQGLRALWSLPSCGVWLPA